MADQSASLPAQPSVREKRASPRIDVALPVLLSTWEGQHRARVRNLSRGGALVEAETSFRAGCQVDFQCGTIETRGTVVWQDDNCFGVSFRFPVDDARVAQQVARSDAIKKHRQAKEA
jgi:hypothetical protein